MGGMVPASGSGRRRPAIQDQARFALGFGFVHGGNLLAVGFALGAAFLGGLNAADAAPTFPGLGINQAHLLFGMMRSTVVAKGCF